MGLLCSKVSAMPDLINNKDDQTNKIPISTTVQEPSENKSAKARIMENFIIIWLDTSIHKSDKNTQNSIALLQSIVNTIELFTNIDLCTHFLNKIKNEKVFMIVSNAIDRPTMLCFENMTQLHSIYVLYYEKLKHEEWIKACRKVKGVYSEIESICDELKRDVRRSESDLTPISIDTNLNQSFMYSQLLKEILLTMKYDTQAKKEFVDFCRIQYAHNSQELKIIDEFQRDYDQPSPIWWYTRECFTYSMLNKALRTQDIEVIIKMGFFVCDIHRQIERLHVEANNRQVLILYRGQGMSHSEFEKMNTSKGGLLSFHNFLSTSSNRHLSLNFSRLARTNVDLVAILFQMKIDPSVSSAPFAALDDISFFSDTEKEILFSMHTVFRIGEIKQIEDRLWQVNLTLIADNDPQLAHLTEHIRNTTRGETGAHRIGKLMIEMGEFDKAEEIYRILVERTSDDNRKEVAHLHHQLGLIYGEKGDLTNALSYFKQSLNLYLTCLSSDDPELSPIYSNIGMLFRKQGDLDNALAYFECALNIDLHETQPNQLEIALRHNNIGGILEAQGKHAEALKSYRRALGIQLAHLPLGHSSLATTLNSIGLVYYSTKDYTTALTYFEKTLEIEQRSLPPNHPSLMITHANIAGLLEDLGRYKDAIEYAERTLAIARQTLDSNHPQVQTFQNYLDQLRRKSSVH